MMQYGITKPQRINTLRLRQNDRHCVDDIFKCIFFGGNALISIEISLKNIPALVHHLGDKPLSEPMMASLPMQICTTLPQ